MLGLRNLGRQFIKHIIGLGNKVFLWLDGWLLDRPPLPKYGFRTVYDVGSNINALLQA